MRRMISSSSSLSGYPTDSFSMKRSTCASGSGYVPSWSMGFWVARTRKGDGRSKVSWPIVTVCSCMASSSADWTLAGDRLISSARITFAKIGPFLVLNSVSLGS